MKQTIIDSALYPSYYKEVTINQMEIQSLNTTPIRFLPSPKKNKRIRMDKCNFIIDTDTAFNGPSTAVALTHTDALGPVLATTQDGFLDVATPSVAAANSVTDSQPLNDVIDKEIFISALNDMTLGSAGSELKIQLWYTILPL